MLFLSLLSSNYYNYTEINMQGLKIETLSCMYNQTIKKQGITRKRVKSE